MKKNILAAIIIASVVILDIITKYLIVQHVSRYSRIDFLGGFIRFTLIYNDGGVFGILQGYKNLFLVVSIIVLILIIIYYILEKHKSTIFCITLALIIGGAIGNIIDRVIPGRPGVVDFISIGVNDVYRWPSFNVADSVIVIGAFLLIIIFYKEERKRKK